MHLRWTQLAARDLTRICDFIEEHGSAATARRLETRELVIAGLPYIAVYRSQPEVVEVLRILHGAQKWP